MDVIHLNGIGNDWEPFDEKVVEIFTWYDRRSRNWIIQLLNKDRYQVGDAIYVGDRASKDLIVANIKAEYGIR